MSAEMAGAMGRSWLAQAPWCHESAYELVVNTCGVRIEEVATIDQLDTVFSS